MRVSSDIRLIVHKTQNSLLLCYRDHHDKAYDWAERRTPNAERRTPKAHPKTGAAQIVEIPERLRLYKANLGKVTLAGRLNAKE